MALEIALNLVNNVRKEIIRKVMVVVQNGVRVQMEEILGVLLVVEIQEEMMHGEITHKINKNSLKQMKIMGGEKMHKINKMFNQLKVDGASLNNNQRKYRMDNQDGDNNRKYLWNSQVKD